MTNTFFEPPYGGVRGNACTSSIARWKARALLRICYNWTFFASSYRWDVIRRYWSKSAFFKGGSAISKGQMAYFPLRMRETAKFLLSIKNLTTPSCSPTQISYKMQKFWQFGHKYGPYCIFFIAHAQNGLISTSCQKSDVTVVFPDPDFLWHAGI